MFYRAILDPERDLKHLGTVMAEENEETTRTHLTGILTRCGNSIDYRKAAMPVLQGLAKTSRIIKESLELILSDFSCRDIKELAQEALQNKGYDFIP